MVTKLNCWEFRKCGREPGGVKCKEKGICPAATEVSGNGIYGGKKSGRICWAVAGTFCGGIIHCDCGQKSISCMICDFFKLVMSEEGPNKFNLLKFEQIWDITEKGRLEETHQHFPLKMRNH